MENFFSKAYADTLYQPVDSDLTAIAALSTTVFGRALLALADAAALRSAIDFAEAVDDEVATLLQAGTDVTVTYNDAANTLTVGLGANVPRLNAANTFSSDLRVGNANEYVQLGSNTNSTITAWSFALGAHYLLIGDSTGSGGPMIFRIGNQGSFVWQSTNRADAGTPQLGFRNNAGTFEINNGTFGTGGPLSCGTVRVGGGTIVQNILSATATLDFPSIAASSFADLTITVTGAVSGDTVIVNPIAGSATTDVVYTGWVSAANTVTIRASNVSSTTARDPASGTFRATVVRF